MNVGVAHSESNPNSSWLSGRGSWVSYGLAVLTGHLILRTIPFVHGGFVWTLTHILHNLITYVFLHTFKGAPWENTDQGKSRRLTHWEQIDSGHQFSDTKKFLTVVPIMLCLLACHMTDYEFAQFAINLATLLPVVLAKMPFFHKVRLWDINKY